MVNPAVARKTLSIGVYDARRRREVLQPLIFKGAQLPTAIEDRFFTRGEGENSFDLTFYAGEGTEVSSDSIERIGALLVGPYEYPEPAAFRIRLEITSDGMIETTVTHEDTDKKYAAHFHYRNKAAEKKRQDGVFISYAREDERRAEKLYHSLKKAGVEAWLDKRAILPGQDWKSTINKAIHSCRIFLALMSSHSVDKRGYVQKELRIALNMLDEFPPDSIYLIPVRLDDCYPVHGWLADLQWVDLFPDFDSGFARMIEALKAEGVAPSSE